MQVEDATDNDIIAVTCRLRASDAIEFFSVARPGGPVRWMADLQARLAATPGMIVARADDGEPVAVGAVVEQRANVGTLLFLATDRFPEIALPLTRFIRQRLFPSMRAAGVHRLECVSIAGHTAAHRWVKALGLTQEAVMPGYGRGGETFIQFAWVAEHVRAAGAGA